jgi:cAMP-dependent protein kinase regulator
VPRTATVRARTPCLVLTLTRESFDGLLSGAPQVRATIKRTATARQREMDALRAPQGQRATAVSAQ